ncbi:MAG: HAD family hydrolase [Ruminococcaceae bacterium]|nr:HAD family hydrolase [Oscillospiraceae bacterium]
MKITAAIFDMDGTLVDSLMLWDVLWSAFGERYLNDKTFLPEREDDKRVRTLTLADAMELIHNNYSIGENGKELLELANNIMIDFYSNSVELKEGVREFLEYLGKNGVKMCIASATAPELLDIALKHCDIEKYFLNVFSCGAIGKGKDKPDVFLMAQEFLGTETCETWVFEDSLTAIETAVKIGMPTVGIYDRYNFGQEKIKEISNEYIAEGETLLKLIG